MKDLKEKILSVAFLVVILTAMILMTVGVAINNITLRSIAGIMLVALGAIVITGIIIWIIMNW